MTADDHLAEQSADEIFSGPTHELVPSSYSSFHRHHWPHYEDEDPMEDSNRRRSFRSSFSRSRRESTSSRASFGSFNSLDSDERSNFHFFSRDEILNADGASTVFGDDDSVNESHWGESDRESAANESEYSLPTFSEESTVDSNNGYRSTRLQQRYYIAEEDMRIVCAGYSIIRWRLLLFRILSVASLGLLYIWGRWFPRHRLRITSQEVPLGQCEFLVVENQWGEVEKVEINSTEYNNVLSTVFNTVSADAYDQTQSQNLRDNDINSVRHSISASDCASVYVDRDPNMPVLREFTYRYIRFLYNPLQDMFFTNSNWVSNNWAQMETSSQGIDGDVQLLREKVFGKNSLEIAQPPLLKLLMDEVFHPFYMFQVFSIILWCLDEYIYYAGAIFVISAVSIAQALRETKTGMKRLQDIAQANNDTELTVLRSGYLVTLSSEELVPGDVFELSDPTLTSIPADCVLLSGDCILNESILTGESVPVSKIPATDQSLSVMVEQGLSSNAINRSFLYAGTKIIRVRKPPAEREGFQPALALVVRTGFSTTKGSLVRSMMFPKPSSLKFYRDSFRYIGVMAIVAVLGFSISAFRFVELGMNWSLIVLRALDIITVVVPPALPATLTIGTNFSLHRLRMRNIFCITPSRVNVAGRVNLVAFDKTGTITDEGLDVLGIHLVEGSKATNGKKIGPLLTSCQSLESGNELLHTLVACHELRSVDGEVMGDPLDVKMFEFTDYKLDEDRRKFTCPNSEEEIQVFKQFEFVSNLRRMSVVASSKFSESGTKLLAKGAPEIMRQICKPESIPPDFDNALKLYTHRGYRVIACAWRDIIDITDYDREELERDLTFAGLIVFENKLKPQSGPAIKQLNEANIRTLMCTGDNVLTAVSVGRECGMIKDDQRVFVSYLNEDGTPGWEDADSPNIKLDPNTLKPQFTSDPYILAVTGDVFSQLIEQGSCQALEQMLLHGVVYARMSPDEKHELVSKLKQIDYTVSFCGDGANDCGALKEADVGISLSEAEASVAAPFTSRIFDISCVPEVLCEGRCALNTSFNCFKYMSMYSAIQFATVTILYSGGSNIGDFQFLWIDLFLIVPIAAFMSWSGPMPRLSKKRPGAQLVSRKVLVPLLSYMVIVGFMQFVAWKMGKSQSYYTPPVPGDNGNLKSTDNTTLFYASSFQYILFGYLLCEGPPFRVPISRNKPFVLTLFATIGFTLLFMSTNPASGLGQLMDLTYLSFGFKFNIIILSIVTLGILIVCKNHVFKPMCDLVYRIRRLGGYVKERPRYKEIIEEQMAVV